MSTRIQDWRHKIENLSDFNKHLFNNEQMSDLTFVFVSEEGVTQKIFAHSWLLALVSPVFSVLMKETFERKKEIPVIDYQYDDFLVYLKHFYINAYTGDLERYKVIWSLCEKFKTPFIKKKYVILLHKMPVTFNNALRRLEYALFINCDDEVNRTLHFIGCVDTFLYLCQSEFINLTKEALKCILNINKIRNVLSEMALFTATMKWAAKRCEENEWTVNSENKRRSLEDLIKLIRFPLMTTEQFANCIAVEENLLSLDEKTSILKEITSGENNETGFNSSPRLKYFQIFFQINLYCGNPKPFRTTFTCDKEIYIDSLWIASPKNINNIVVAELFQENGELLYSDHQVVQFSEYTSCRQFPLKLSFHILPYVKYCITLLYEQHGNVFVFDSFPQEFTNDNIRCDFTEMANNFNGFLYYM